MSNLECIASIMNLLSHLTSWDDDDMYRVSVLASVLCKFFVFFFTIFRSFRLVIHSCLPVSKLLRARHSVRTDIKWKCLGAKCYIPKVIGNVCRWAMPRHTIKAYHLSVAQCLSTSGIHIVLYFVFYCYRMKIGSYAASSALRVSKLHYTTD